MNDRVLDFSEQPVFLSVRNRLLVIRLRPVAAASDRPGEKIAGEDTGATAVVPRRALVYLRSGSRQTIAS